MTYVLDTNAVSAVTPGELRVLARLREAPKQDVLVPHPVFAEIAYGIARVPKSKKRDALCRRFELVKHELLRAEWTDKVSEAFGEIKSLLPRCQSPPSWGRLRGFSPPSWGQLFARVMGPPAG